MEIVKISRYKKFLICVDSLSVLQCLEGRQIRNPILLDLLERYEDVSHAGKEIVFCWIRSHVGISGNETADKAAKEALNDDPSPFLVPASDFLPNVSKYVTDLWQAHWDQQKTNKLHRIKPQIGPRTPSLKNVRDDLVITRAKLGHTYPTGMRWLPTKIVGYAHLIRVHRLLCNKKPIF